ncbi:butyrophilin-like protein 2 isoform 6-T13 [Dama dama]|uniref:butyrophilin-like protein 2 isoform X6 n=1 Tax=Dama dama TaxID=30532 RepID=UPI002A366D93|nr:butyrophilin-like protein 2 isoform X6 [Dama dama]
MVELPGYSLSGVFASFFFILLSTKQSDDFRVTGSAHPILAMVGEDAQLTCQLLPRRTAMDMEVRWYRSEPSTPVFLYPGGDEITEIQMEEYRGRVEWIEDGITEGSVALKIHSLRPSDHGQYWCRFKDNNYLAETSLLLQVATSLKVIGPSQPILVRVGEDIQLTCSLAPNTDAQKMEVRWVRSHRYPAVYVYMDGARVAGEQMEEYRGRTALLSDAMSEGRLTLQINDARISDDGKYWCLFEKDGVYQEADLDLKIVGLGSSPKISMEGLKDGEVMLKCTSEGWFPQPHVQWRDTEGNTIPSFSQDLTQGSQGLFQVEAILLVTNSSVVNVTCSISSPLLGEEKNTTFSTSESGMIYSWKRLLIWGLLLLLLLGVIGLIWRKSCGKVHVGNSQKLPPIVLRALRPGPYPKQCRLRAPGTDLRP